MSIPWGEIKGDQDLGGYHLVDPRSLHSAIAPSPLARPARHYALIWLAAIQRPDGSFPQS
jgi:glucoamylase